MLKILITIALILILTTSIYSQADAKGGFRGGGFFGGLGGGGGKLYLKFRSSGSRPWKDISNLPFRQNNTTRNT